MKENQIEIKEYLYPFNTDKFFASITFGQTNNEHNWGKPLEIITRKGIKEAFRLNVSVEKIDRLLQGSASDEREIVNTVYIETGNPIRGLNGNYVTGIARKKIIFWADFPPDFNIPSFRETLLNGIKTAYVCGNPWDMESNLTYYRNLMKREV